MRGWLEKVVSKQTLESEIAAAMENLINPKWRGPMIDDDTGLIFSTNSIRKIVREELLRHGVIKPPGDE